MMNSVGHQGGKLSLFYGKNLQDKMLAFIHTACIFYDMYERF